jgi:receptor protein-tyrosine kinase
VLSNREEGHHLRLLSTERFSRLLERLEQDCDVIVIDSPPLPEVAEGLAMASAVEAVLISVRLGHTRREKLAQLRELLARRGVSPLGFVLTTRERQRQGYDYDYAREIARPAEMKRTPVAKQGMRLIDQ